MLRLVLLLVCLMTMAAIPVHATEQKRVVILESMLLPHVQQSTDWMLSQLAEFGFVAGENLTVVRLNAEAERQIGIEVLKTELMVNGKPDLVISVATVASQAAKSVLEEFSIPQLFVMVKDPISAGLIRDLGQPEISITGRSHAIAPITRLKIVQDLLRSDKTLRVGVLHSSYPSSKSDLAYLMEAARTLDTIKLIPLGYEFNKQDDYQVMLDEALSLIKQNQERIDLLWLATGPASLKATFIRGISRSAKRPIIYGPSATSVENGALLALYADANTIGTDAGHAAARLLSGTPPFQLPPGRINRFSVALNMSTATRLDIVFPSDLLELAGDNLVW